MEMWQLYLMVTLPGVSKMLGLFGFILFLVGGILLILKIVAGHDSSTNAKEFTEIVGRKALVGFCVGVLMLILTAAIPSKSGVYTLIGGYYVTNLDGIKNLPPAALKAANRFLENYAESKAK